MGDSSGSRTHAHLPNLDRNSDRCPVSGQPQLVQIEPLLLQSAARRFRCCSSLTFTSARTRAARNVAPRCDATISSALLLNAQLSRIRAGSLGHRNGTRANRPSQSSRPRSSQRSPLGSGHDHIDLPAAAAGTHQPLAPIEYGRFGAVASSHLGVVGLVNAIEGAPITYLRTLSFLALLIANIVRPRPEQWRKNS